MTRNTQSNWVLAQLEAGKTLSSRNAVLEYGIQDLPKRISELRRAGHRIQSIRVDGYNRHGGKTHWNLYLLEKEGVR
jgi:biotin operon repressor